MVHERVREHIRQMQVKQSWLAKRMYLSEGALSLILAGKRKMTVDELERLCATLCAVRHLCSTGRSQTTYIAQYPP